MRLAAMLPLLLLALTVPGVASAADPGFALKHIKVTARNIGPAHDQTCVIDGDLYTPTGVDAAHPAAAILTTNGFGGSKTDQATLAGAYATRGYVVLSYSGLGFGASDCKIELDNPDWDGMAASAMIDFLGGGRAADDGTQVDYVIHDARDHSNHAVRNDPRVGMIGGSYGGEVQFAAASVDKRLDTIVPQITWNDLAYSLSPNNANLTDGVSYPLTAPGVEKFQWVSLFFGVGVAGTGGGTAGSQDPSHLGACPNFDDQACAIKAQMDATGFADEPGITFARKASVRDYMREITIPTFLAQGQNDTLFNLNEAVATYNSLRGQGTPVKMLWRSNGHSGGDLGNSEDANSNPEIAYASRAYLEWFDYYLRGIGDAPKLDFSYYRDWVKFPAGADAAPAVATTAAYPAAGDSEWFLSGDGTLVPTAGAAKAGAPSFQFAPGGPTSYSETSGGRVANAAPTDADGTFAAFTSPALTADTDVVGIPKVTVSLTAQPQSATQAQPAGRLVLFAKLYEVKADGTKELPNRLVAPVRVADLGQPQTITLPGIAHRFAKGSRLQLVLAASDAAYKNNNAPGQATVNIDPTKPSRLTVPVLSVPAPAPVVAPAGSQSPGAGQQAQVKQEGITGSAGTITTPAKSCHKNRRVITIHFTGVRKPDRIISRTVTINGKRIKAGHRKTLRISLKHRKAGTYRISVVVKSKKGKVRRTARTYKVC